MYLFYRLSILQMKCKVDFILGNATSGNLKADVKAQASGGNEVDVRRRGAGPPGWKCKSGCEEERASGGNVKVD
jgi:hypothetical protein